MVKQRVGGWIWICGFGYVNATSALVSVCGEDAPWSAHTTPGAVGVHTHLRAATVALVALVHILALKKKVFQANFAVFVFHC